MPSSLFIVNAANPMLRRSRRATAKSRKTKGRILIRSLRMVLESMAIPPATIPVVMKTSARVRPDGRFLSAGDGGQRRAKFGETVFLQSTPVKQLADSFSLRTLIELAALVTQSYSSRIGGRKGEIRRANCLAAAELLGQCEQAVH